MSVMRLFWSFVFFGLDPPPPPSRIVIIHSPAGLAPLPPPPVPVLFISLLENSKWLDRVDETFSKQLQHVSKVFHQLFLTINLPSRRYGIHNSGGAAEGGHPLLWRRPKAASIMVDGKEANIAIQLIPNERPSSMKATFLEIQI